MTKLTIARLLMAWGAAGSASWLFALCELNPVSRVNRPLLPAGRHELYEKTFIDPTAQFQESESVFVSCKTYIGPFVEVNAAEGAVTIGEETNLQDNVVVSSKGGKPTLIGDKVILAHNASVLGSSKIGKAHGMPAFVGFNAVVYGATVEEDAMVGHLAYVDKGVVIKKGLKVLPGKYIKTQEQAQDVSLGKVAPVTDADRAFMAGVLHVNESLAHHYSELFVAEKMNALRGISKDPGYSDFNSLADLPALAGATSAVPGFRNRIVGYVSMGDDLAALDRVMGEKNSIRADEGDPFKIGKITRMGNQVTFHALEFTRITAGDDNVYGNRVVIHGGTLPAQDGSKGDMVANEAEPQAGAEAGGSANETKIGAHVTIGDWSVVFRSHVGDGCKIGAKSLVEGTVLAPGTVVPEKTILINGAVVGQVEW